MMLVFLVLMGGLAIAACAAQHVRGRNMVRDWAYREGMELIAADLCWFWRGPFWLRSGKGNLVYRVLVRDAAGDMHSGYVRCGGLFLGMLSDEIAVEWD